LKTAYQLFTVLIFSAYMQQGFAEHQIHECGENPIVEFLEFEPLSAERLDHNSPEFAERWLTFTECKAEKGDSDAQLKMGIAFRDGADGPPQNFGRAREWFLKSAKNGNGMAMYNLGLMSLHGQGTDLDFMKAYMWFSLATSFLPQDGGGFKTRNRAFEYRDQAAERLNSSQLAGAQKLSIKRYREIRGTP